MLSLVADDQCDVLRGTWFYQSTRQPLEAELALKIEKEHMNNFKGQPIETDGIISAKTSKLIIPKCPLALTRLCTMKLFMLKQLFYLK